MLLLDGQKITGILRSFDKFGDHISFLCKLDCIYSHNMRCLIVVVYCLQQVWLLKVLVSK